MRKTDDMDSIEIGMPEADIRQGAAAGGDPLYVVGEWGHLFPSARGDVERQCRIVFDLALGEVVRMEVHQDHRWRGSSLAERQDVTDSLVNANPEAIEKPAEWDLEFASEMPAWAG